VSAPSIFLDLVHTLAGAGWFGAMLYSLNVLHPKAREYFNDDRQYEEFMANLAHGARKKMFYAFALMGGTGAAMAALHWKLDPLWLALLGLKIALFLAALVLFCLVTFWFWPLRVFATDAELPMHHQRFKRIGIAMQMLVGMNMALGIVAHAV